MDRARRRDAPAPTDPRRNTRLAYSTGGDVEAEMPAAPAPAQAKGGARLRLERRASGRVVTVVARLPGDPAAVAGLARELRAACGAGGTFRDGVVELQGDQRDKVEAWLRARGVPSKRAGG